MTTIRHERVCVQPDAVQAVMQNHLAQVDEPSRWEHRYPIRMGPGWESWTLTLEFDPAVGDLAELFPIAAPYALNDRGDFVAEGKWIRICDAELSLSIAGTQLPAWDEGVQDAVLQTIATELLPFLQAATLDRTTDSPFEDLPSHWKGDQAAALVTKLAGDGRLVQVEWEIDYFRRPQCANPNLEVHFEGARHRHVASAREHALDDLVHVPVGAYEATAVARVSAQPLARWLTNGKRFNEILWTSQPLEVEIVSGFRYRFAVGLRPSKRFLTPAERRFMEDPRAKLPAPRQILHLHLLQRRKLGE